MNTILIFFIFHYINIYFNQKGFYKKFWNNKRKSFIFINWLIWYWILLFGCSFAKYLRHKNCHFAIHVISLNSVPLKIIWTSQKFHMNIEKNFMENPMERHKGSKSKIRQMEEYFPTFNKNMRQQKEALKHKFAWTSIVMNLGSCVYCSLRPTLTQHH